MSSTPIYDFVSAYARLSCSRFHVPGHKGLPLLGPEPLDLTEIAGADDLYDPEGIIAESQSTAASLFGTGATFYSTEGSSHCIRAMFRLLLAHRPDGSAPRILAARNVHRSFVSAAVLLDADVSWLYPESFSSPLSCLLSPASLDRALADLPEPPAAVYVTSPDYLGATQDISSLSEVCHRRGTLLAVDNAHGAYLHFLSSPIHPMDLGADICCDSAHKTLPVLTGGAYLHLSERCPPAMIDDVPSALSLFGSSSPSYLTLASLDLCNEALASSLPSRIRKAAERTSEARSALLQADWSVLSSDPLRITVRTDGPALAGRLRNSGVEPEYVDPDHVVLMTSADTSPEDFPALLKAAGPGVPSSPQPDAEVIRGTAIMSMREALFAHRKAVCPEDAVGRICADISAACPPAVPLAMPGERISEGHASLFRHYGIHSLSVVL